MMEINKQETLTPWSLRDISKLFTRLYKQYFHKDEFDGMTIEYNILFYILSSTNESLVNERIELICELITKVFNKVNLYDELKDLYNEIPILIKRDINEEKRNLYIKKGNVKLYYRAFEQNLYNELKHLPSVLDALFKMIISSDDEPLLISGPSSFKTYLAKKFLKTNNIEIISLNSEITMSQLIGSNVPIIKEESKLFYLKAIYEILDVTNIESKLKYLENFEKNIPKIREIIEKEKVNLEIKPKWLEYAFKNLEEKLFKNEANNKLENNKLLIEFQPGILLSAVIKKKSLILKKIADVKTENLERLNECLTGNKKITLNEDIQNTYTKENKKEINLGKDFRIIATCNEGEESKLSDAFISRFTLIYVNKYTKDEEKKVLSSKELERLDKYIKNYYEKFKYEGEFSLAQKINCFRIYGEINKIRNGEIHTQKENLKLAIYMLLLGLTQNREKKPEKLVNKKNIEILNSIFKFENYYEDNLSKSPLERVEKHEIQSKMFEIKFRLCLNNNISNDKDINDDIIFTTKMKCLLDTIHFGISTKTPIVLEGSYGQGKSKAIDYYCKLTGLKPIKIVITKYTKIEDLFGKTIIKTVKGVQTLVVSKTDFCKALECTDNTINTLIILEGINNASPSILGIINDIFGTRSSKILVNGTPIKKNYINLICIFNSSDDMTKEKLPINIINNSLYYIVENPSNIDIKDIILNLFERENLKIKNNCKFTQEEAQQFFDNFIKAKEISENGIGEFPFTLNEVKKYISLRTNLPEIDKTFFMTIIFQHHFTQGENILKAQKNLKLDSFLFSPYISYNNNNLKFKASRKSKKNQIEIKIKKSKIDEYKLKNKFDCMTLTEKLCFLFLLCCIKADKVPIIQGLTASGKSYITMLLAELLGYKLSIYQLNANSGISIFTGQSIMNDKFSKDEKSKINKILELIDPNYSYKDLNSKSLEHNFKDFDKLIKGKNGKGKEKYEKAKNELMLLTSTMSRFKKEDSEFVKGIREGNFVCLDGIEAATEQISQKIASLCGESKTLNIYESGDDELIFNRKNIHKNFRLFIIYNPLSKGAKKIDQTLFNNCIKFTLPSIDFEPRDITTLLYKSITNSKNNHFWSDLCGRLASYHIFQVQKTMNNVDIIAGGAHFTSRILTFIYKDYNKTFKNFDNPRIEEWLKCIFDTYYWRSYISYNDNKKYFINDAYDIIKKQPEKKYKVDEELDFKIEFKEIIEDLMAIQNYAIDNVEYNNFNFSMFVENCLKIPLNKAKIRNIANNIEDTILLLDNNITMSDEIKSKFYQINMIKDILRNIENNFDNISSLQEMKKLEDDELLKNKDIESYLLRLKILNQILKNQNSKQIYEPSININLINNPIPILDDLCIALGDLLKNKNKLNFITLIQTLFETPILFNMISILYPFEELNNIEEIKFNEEYIELWSSLFAKKNNFIVRIEKKKYSIDFNESQENNIIPYFIFNEKNSILLSKNSYLLFKKKYSYIDNVSDKETSEMINDCFDYAKIKRKKKEKINNYNLFSYNETPMIGRAISILLNLEKYHNLIIYLKQSFSYLEKDVLETMEILFKEMTGENYKYIIDNLFELNFFCDDNSILWKYRNNMNKVFENEEEEYEDKEINFESEINLAYKELNNIKKLKNLYFDDEKVKKYENNLKALINEFEFAKRKDDNKKEMREYYKKGANLLKNIQKYSQDNIQGKDLIEEEINKFIKSKNINKELYEKLEKKVKDFIEFNNEIYTKKDNNNFSWPKKKISNQKNLKEISEEYKLYELIFKYSEIEQIINELLNPETSYKNYLRISTDLNTHQLQHINNFIKEKRDDTYNNQLSNDQRKQVKSMIRAELLSSLMNNKIEIDKIQNFVENINEKMKLNDNILEEEYFYIQNISSNYSPNLKIKMPIFEPNDIFHLFFKYDTKDKYKLGDDIIDEKLIGNINDKIDILLKKDFKDCKDIVNEIGCLLFIEITGDEKVSKDTIIEIISQKLIHAERLKKSELKRICEYIKYIHSFNDTVIISQKKTKKSFKLDDF